MSVTVVLSGKIAAAGADRVRERFGDRISLVSLPGGVDGNADAEARRQLAIADVIVSDCWGPEHVAPRATLLQLPISGLDRVDPSSLYPQTSLCNV